MSMTAEQGATRTKRLRFTATQRLGFERTKNDHLKIKKHGDLVTQVGYVEIGQQYILAK